MGQLIRLFYRKERLSGKKLILFLSCVVFGLLLTLLFNGKMNIDFETIAVSPDEEYVACFETGVSNKILCFNSDGSLRFDFDIPTDISSGGYCTLWFEDNILCALFYRTDKVVHFSTEGTILRIVDNTLSESPPEFLSFSKEGHQYVFTGNEISVVYEKRGLFDYWLFGAERYLAITNKDGNTNVVLVWTAETDVAQETVQNH